MKKLALIIVLAGWLATFAFAKEIDVAQSKGTDQSVIVSFTPKPAFMDTDQNITLEAVFNIPLDETSVQKNNVKLKKITENKESTVDGEAAYNASKNAVTFSPGALLEFGYYEAEYKSLKPVKEHKDQQIKEIKYRFYVPEVVNGYKLPPEPDKALNDSTLLGVDVNENGVRDDVERYIVIKYQDHHKIVTEIGLQMARAYQKAIAAGSTANKSDRYILDAMECNFYFRYDATEFGDPVLIDHTIDIKNIQLNTKSRVYAYLEYDRVFSGGVYSLTPADQEKSKCNFE